MTTEELLDFIDRNSLPGEWELKDPIFVGYIRHKRTGECPICWVASQLGVNTYADTQFTNHVAKKLELSFLENLSIVEAADNTNIRGDTVLREALLKVCKL